MEMVMRPPMSAPHVQPGGNETRRGQMLRMGCVAREWTEGNRDEDERDGLVAMNEGKDGHRSDEHDEDYARNSPYNGRCSMFFADESVQEVDAGDLVAETRRLGMDRGMEWKRM